MIPNFTTKPPFMLEVYKMKITELIEKLEHIKLTVGDLRVALYTEETNIQPVRSISIDGMGPGDCSYLFCVMETREKKDEK